MDDKIIIQPKGMAEAVGPFSRAILIGNYLHIAGTTALSHIKGDYTPIHRFSEKPLATG